jgi:hypothetical protein
VWKVTFTPSILLYSSALRHRRAIAFRRVLRLQLC